MERNREETIMATKKLQESIALTLTLSTLCFGTALAAEQDKYTEDLGEVVVTAERIPAAAKNVPADVTVITAEDIKDNHYRSTAEALSHINGVVMTNGGNGYDETIRIQGEERVVILVDGERLNDDQGSMSRATATLSRVPQIDNVERIEIVKGGSSALYGSDAIGGVVNIITKTPTKNKTTLDMNTGSWHTHNYVLSNEGREGKTSWQLVGGLNKRSYFSYKGTDGDSHRMPSSDYSNNNLSLKVKQELTPAQSLTLRFNHQLINGNQYYYQVPTGFVASGKQQNNFNDGSLTWKFKEDTKLPGFLRYFDHNKSADFSGKFSTRLQGIDYQNGWKLDANNKLVAGLEYHHSNSSNKQSGYEDKKIINKAAYVQDTMRLNPKWFFVPGVRVDNHTSFGTHWTPKAGLTYRADKATKLFASWGRVYKAPTADDMFYIVDYGAWGSYKGNPNLKAETGHTESLGITHDFDAKSTVSASYFHSVLNDAIAWYSPDYTNYTVTNIDHEKRQGIELSWKQQLTSAWSYDIGYTYTDTNTSAKDGYLRHNSMPNAYRLGLHYQQGAWKANLMSRVGTGLDKASYGNRHFAVWDFNTSYEASKQLTVYLKALNFTNQAYSVYSSYRYPAAGRFFQLGMTYQF